MQIEIIPIPAYQDNYIWLLHNGQDAAVVDPGESEQVEQYLIEHNLKLKYILITHHHWDHVNGLVSLQKNWDCEVFAPIDTRIPGDLTSVKEQDQVHLPELELTFNVFEIPGHTLTHICFFNDLWLFSGDTLFSIGCGRMFEGNPTQFVDSLNKLKSLNPNTAVFCGHEYTLNNINFALTLEPNHDGLQKLKQEVQKKRNNNEPTLPVTLGQEFSLNPFLRIDTPELQKALSNQMGKLIEDEVSCFAQLRLSKDQF